MQATDLTPTQQAWITRRLTFGTLSSTPFSSSDTAPPNPWADFAPYEQTDPLGAYVRNGIVAWLDHMLTTDRQVEEWMTFFWHHHFAVSIQVVRPPHLMFDHVHLLRRHAMGNFGVMLREVTVDPAMLIFLNGTESTAANPNENFGRELLELYALGVGNFDEADVQAASTALTGWVARRQLGVSQFAPRRHDDSPQKLLGIEGIHDVDTVIDAVTSHPACAVFIAEKLGRAILGHIDAELAGHLARVFASANLEIRPLLEAIVTAGLEGRGTPIINAPIPWFIQARAALGNVGITRAQAETGGLQSMGQIPLRPPNVGGFPKPDTYLGSSAIAGRFALATALAVNTTTENATRAAAASQDWALLASLLNRPEGFGPATIAGLTDAAQADRNGQVGVSALGLALASPELMIA